MRECDVFILLSDGPAGTGRYVELGAAIQSQPESQKPLIYVVGERNMDSIFYFHPTVKRRGTIEEVLEEIV